jgi:hypothetical protein
MFRRTGWIPFCVCALVVVNLALLLMIGLIRSSVGSPVRVHEFALLGISAGHLCLAIFVMVLGNLRFPVRLALCHIFVLVSVVCCHLGLITTHEFFRRAYTDILAFHQIFFIGALWVGYACLAPLRAIFTFEMGMLKEGSAARSRSFQFRLSALALLVVIVAVACTVGRMLVGLYLQANSSRSVPLWEIALPFAVLGTVLIAGMPILLTSLLRGKAAIWLMLSIGWGALPLYIIDPALRPFIATAYAAFWLTVVLNLLCIRWIGFRWLPSASAKSARRNPILPDGG